MTRRRAKTAKTIKKTGDHAVRLTIVIVSVFLLLVGATVLFNLNNRASAFCANSISCIKNLTGHKENTNQGEYMGQKVTTKDVDEKQLFALDETRNVLGASTGDAKHIYVDLAKQQLYAYDGTKLVYTFAVSTGKWHPTPTGDFRIWIWLRYTRMTGGDKTKGTYYDLPNVPYTMYFSNASVPKSDGYSLHGAYWHNNFGHPMSHGCVNLRPEDAGKIYYWTNPTARDLARPTTENPGTLITIYGAPPPGETSYVD